MNEVITVYRRFGKLSIAKVFAANFTLTTETVLATTALVSLTIRKQSLFSSAKDTTTRVLHASLAMFKPLEAGH